MTDLILQAYVRTMCDQRDQVWECIFLPICLPENHSWQSERHLDPFSLVLSQVKSHLRIIMQAVGMWYVYVYNHLYVCVCARSHFFLPHNIS